VAVGSRLVSGQTDEEFRVIVHPTNSVNTLSAMEVSRYYLDEGARWPNGDLVVAVDRNPDSPVRSAFSNRILGRDVASVRAHWRRLIFQGKGVPPPTRGSDQEIVVFVSANPNAIGYVSSSTPLGADVKVVALAN
jgi:ABC-type phosphate transport system substrate-binding protein